MNIKEAGGLLLAGAIATSCGGQVDGLKMVDCEKGPSEAELTLVANPGRNLKIGSVTLGDELGLEQSVLILRSNGNGSFKFNLRHQIKEWTVDSNPDKQYKIGPVLVNEDDSIIFNSGNVELTIKGDPGENGSTEFDIKAKCT
jgi:hypothetical protein